MKNPHLKIKKLVESHNLWASSAGFAGKRSSFAKEDFGGLILQDFNFNHADFRESNLKNVTFQNCKLRDCRFDFSSFENTKFINCSIAQTSFNGTDISTCDFTDTDIGDSERLLEMVEEANVYPSLKPGKLYRLSSFLNRSIRRKASHMGREIPEQEVYYAVCLEDKEEGVDILVGDIIIREIPRWTKLCGFHEP